ncbi:MULTISPECIES: ArsR/SmtB family transcription factor [unclassified Streptomyces]|uniref:ArsR/SmtB family transcription factor n=1 Tax=unclassified Streptomyces TaxID=2593676 RepID=UPI00380C7A01
MIVPAAPPGQRAFRAPRHSAGAAGRRFPRRPWRRTRLRVVESGFASLAGQLPVSRQAVVKHLTVLDGAGLVSGGRAGREVRYPVRPAALNATAGWPDWQPTGTGGRRISNGSPGRRNGMFTDPGRHSAPTDRQSGGAEAWAGGGPGQGWTGMLQQLDVAGRPASRSVSHEIASP